MSSTLWVSQPSVSPAPADISAYLRSRKWRLLDVAANWAIYAMGEGEAQQIIEVPQLTVARDYSRSVQVLLEQLGRLEGRPATEVLRDMRAASLDVIRLGLQGSAMRDGRIPVDAGLRAYEGARNLLLAAACSVVEPRTVYANRKPEEAMGLMSRARFGQTEVGSFVLTIECAVAPRLQTALTESPDDPDAPFERKTSVRLATALHAAQEASRTSAATGTIEPFRSRTREGVSANLCDAIAEVLEGSAAEQLRASFSFAAHRPIPRAVPVMVDFSSDWAPFLKEAAARLRDEADYPSYQLLGTIVTLSSRAPAEGGEIQVRADVEGKLRKVRVRLDSAGYKKAIDAHGSVALVRCVGELTRVGQALELQHAREFEVVQQGDADV